MAMPATHIRFAATLAQRLDIQDRTAYISGTIYPDSRWTTGIDRKKTHDQRFLDPNFPSDDFTMGWHVHCRCDYDQGGIFKQLLGDLSDLSLEDRWVRFAAAKTIQDMNDAVADRVFENLWLLTNKTTPNGEDRKAVMAFYHIIQRVYGKKEPVRMSDYVRLWTAVGFDEQRIQKIEKQVERILVDHQLVGRLMGVFDRMIDDFENTGSNAFPQGIHNFTRIGHKVL